MTSMRLTFYVKAAELTQRAATADILADCRLTYAQLAMLLSVARQPGMSGAALARLHGITAQSAGEIISHLVARDLLDRAPDPKNRWTLLVGVTATGRDMVQAAQIELDIIDMRLTEGIDPAALEITRQTLTTIVANGGLIVPT